MRSGSDRARKRLPVNVTLVLQPETSIVQGPTDRVNLGASLDRRSLCLGVNRHEPLHVVEGQQRAVGLAKGRE
jgi:hypothetical protein